MDNFDLKKYLAEGRLFEEDNLKDYWSEWAAGEIKVGNDTVGVEFGDADDEAMSVFKRYVKAVKALNADSKELRDEIAFILEEIFFYNRVDEANLEKVNAFIQNGQIKDYYANQIQLITLNKKKLRSVPLINANFDTGKKNKEYIIESVLRRGNKFNITFDSKGRIISDGLLDSNLLFFCSSYLQDQKDIIEDHIFKKNNEYCLKETTWYNMVSNFDGEFIPELKEDITKVVWKNDKKIKKIKNTFPNIKLLLSI